MTQRTYMTDILHSFYWSFDYATLILSRHFFSNTRLSKQSHSVLVIDKIYIKTVSYIL